MWNLPNIISLGRIAAVPVLLVTLYFGKQQLFAWLLLACLISDILDGLIARAFKLQTVLGAKLDSIGDMGTYFAAIIGLFLFRIEFCQEHYLPVLFVIFLYVLEMLLSFWQYGKISSFHTIMSRIAAYAQGIFIMTLFLFGYYAWIFYPTIVICGIAYGEEIIIVTILKEWQADVKGLYWVLKK